MSIFMKINIMNKLGHVTVLVHDLDEALLFYTEKLGFVKQSDINLGDYRWVTVSAPDQPDFGIVFVLAASAEEKRAVGGQAPGRVLLTLQTDDCQRDYRKLSARGVVFEGEPRQMPYGTDVVFQDLYKNRYDLVEVRK